MMAVLVMGTGGDAQRHVSLRRCNRPTQCCVRVLHFNLLSLGNDSKTLFNAQVLELPSLKPPLRLLLLTLLQNIFELLGCGSNS